MATISEQLQAYRADLADAQAHGHEAVACKLEKQIQDLEAFQQRHPDEATAPTALEMFCDLNPSNLECRVYDD